MFITPEGRSDKMPVEVKCSWQVRRREGKTSLEALVSANWEERAGVHLPFGQIMGYSVRPKDFVGLVWVLCLRLSQ